MTKVILNIDEWAFDGKGLIVEAELVIGNVLSTPQEPFFGKSSVPHLPINVFRYCLVIHSSSLTVRPQSSR